MKYKIILTETFDTLDKAKDFIKTNFPDYLGGDVADAGENCCCIYRWGGYREGIEIHIVKEQN